MSPRREVLGERFDTNDATSKVIIIFTKPDCSFRQLAFHPPLTDDRKADKRTPQPIYSLPKKKRVVPEQGTGALVADPRCIKRLLTSPSDDAVFDGATSAREDDPKFHCKIASFVSIQGVDHICHERLLISTRGSEEIIAFGDECRNVCVPSGAMVLLAEVDKPLEKFRSPLSLTLANSHRLRGMRNIGSLSMISWALLSMSFMRPRFPNVVHRPLTLDQ